MHHPEAPYDVDVAVIGGGPAGMSAAVRCRWVKSYRSLPCSVAVFEPGPIGGLAGWRTCSITGPGYRYIGDGLVTRIMTDFERYAIPVLPHRVTMIRKSNAGFSVQTADGPAIRALSVVVATGMRPLSNERHFLGRGLFVTYMGYEYFPKLFDRIRVAGRRGVVVFGNRKSAHLAELAGPLARATDVLWVIDEPLAVELPDLPGRVVRGRLKQVDGKGSTSAGFDAGDRNDPAAPDFERDAAAGVERVQWVDEHGEEHTHDCSAILLDYNAWENQTRRDWDKLGLDDDGHGFITIDPWCSTSVEGVFAAGDVTGRYRSTAMALGDGVNAGLSAVRYTYRRKFGSEPNLFAYRSADRSLSATERDLPSVRDDDWVVPLVPMERIHAVLRARHLPREAWLDGAIDVRRFVEALSGDRSAAVEVIEAWMDGKMIAIHRMPEFE